MRPLGLRVQAVVGADWRREIEPGVKEGDRSCVTGNRWRIAPIIATYNGPGLRDRATVLADGKTIYFA